MIRVFRDYRKTFTNIVTTMVGSSWTGSDAVVTTETDAITGRSIMVVTGNGSALEPYAYKAQTAAIVGHKYYVRLKAKVTNSVCSVIKLQYGGVTQFMVTSPTIDTVYDVSAVITATSTAAELYLRHSYADAATANGKAMKSYNAFIVDLTETYGAGNEPIASVVDSIPAIWSVDAYKTPTQRPVTVSLCTSDFNSNGDKVIKPMKCLEVKQDNEDWRIEMTADLSYQPYLVQDYLLVVPTKQGNQPFRIKNVSVDGKRVSLKARHVGYDLENYFNRASFGDTYEDFTSWLGINIINFFCIPHLPYTWSSDVSGTGKIVFKEFSVLGSLNENIATFGGHLVFDWWDFQIKETIGQDNQVVIEYGKNLEGASIDEDWNSVCTQIFPYGNNNITIASPYYIAASGVTYDRPYAKKVVFQTDDVVELTALANAYLEQYKVPKINYTVKSDNIQNVAIGDTIKVKARQFEILTNVLGYTYNILTSRIENVEFGNFRKDVRSVFSNIQGQLDETKKSVIQENIQMNAQIAGITSKTVEVSATLANTVVTTVHTFGSQTRAMYLISGFIGSDSVGTYSCMAIVSVGSSLKSFVIYNANAAGLELTFSGMEVRLKQTTGTSQTGTIVIQKIS